MDKIFRSFLHLTCPDCGKEILANFARPHTSRLCLCGRRIEVPRERHSRFHELTPPLPVHLAPDQPLQF